MFRSVCPACREPSSFDDAREGREVECPRCRTPFPARAERRDEGRPARPAKPDGSGSAILSLVLGAVALASAACGVGAVFGLGGLLAGFAGLQSRLRAISILGLVLNLAAIILSIGVVAVFLITQTALETDVPPAPDGTQAPFVNAKK